jgi:hypothetical protein
MVLIDFIYRCYAVMILFSHFYFEIELFCHLSVFCSDDEIQSYLFATSFYF